MLPFFDASSNRDFKIMPRECIVHALQNITCSTTRTLTQHRYGAQTATWETGVYCWCWLQTARHRRPKTHKAIIKINKIFSKPYLPSYFSSFIIKPGQSQAPYTRKLKKKKNTRGLKLPLIFAFFHRPLFFKTICFYYFRHFLSH